MFCTPAFFRLSRIIISKRPAWACCPLTWLAGGVLGLAVLHVALARADLPVRPELDAVGRVEVDHLHLALQPLLFGQRGHHQQRVAQDHAVRPLLAVVVEVDALVEVQAGVQVVEHGQLGRLAAAGCRAQVFHQVVRVDRLLDVDRHRRHGQRLTILLVLALPHQLRVERRVARVEERLGRVLVLGHEVAQFLGGDVGAGVGVAKAGDGGGCRWFLGHRGQDAFSCMLEPGDASAALSMTGWEDRVGRRICHAERVKRPSHFTTPTGSSGQLTCEHAASVKHPDACANGGCFGGLSMTGWESRAD